MRPPMLKLLEVFGDPLGKKNVTGIGAIHHPLGGVDTSTGDIGTAIHIDHAANWPTVAAHT